jgi:flagellar hook-associated protein 1 FlgK
MTIANTLANALSGLTATQRAAELVSSNIANAATPGYGRRELVLASQIVGTSGQGVRVMAVSRAENLAVISDRRLAEASQGDAQARTTYFKRLEEVMGTPDESYSLSGRIAAFDTALTQATSHPESDARLQAVLSSARYVSQGLNAVGKDIQSARLAADNEIYAQVTALNDNLRKVVDINVQIRRGFGLGQDVSSLMDLRQQTVDKISSIVPLRQVQEDDGSIKLYTQGGAILVDGIPASFSFEPVQTIVPEMTLDSGGLSGLKMNGFDIRTDGSGSIIKGGSLAAQFAIRDELGPNAQAEIDAIARDLVERFQDSGLDATRAPGDPGLFTDAGAAFDPLNEVGIAQRIAVNTLVDPLAGGALWRIRDGLGAAMPGPVGNSALISDLRDALQADRTPPSGSFSSGPRSFSVLASDFLSQVGANRLAAEGQSAYATARLETYVQIESQDGVDTDQEMQSLLQIEQAYAANAKVVTTVEQMLDRLMEI